ncbi:hypothetical protein EZ449_14175 [Pedobacter frigidisoli]|uniref:Uncharacterized protein n=1 Tax=Pedobacter frigidisoli TaxID=2530455 RepID=A0A4R0P2N0_9SPHI|nr:hypothetical protein [Pedobacter frigidisoli]TCD07678.1 hypothetical protein EZ449_14175 [Pedobacter frigidisoli]
MQYETYYLEPLILECLSKTTISTGYVRTRIEELRANQFDVRMRFLSHVFAARSKAGLGRYLSIHQTILTGMMDDLSIKLAGEKEVKTLQPLRITLLEHIHEHCASLLAFLLITFPNFIDSSANYPERVNRDWKMTLIKRISAIEDRSVTNEVLKGLCGLAEGLLTNEQLKISPRTGRKWVNLLDDIENIHQPAAISYEEIACLLISHEFNSTAVHNLLCRHLELQLQLSTDPSQLHGLLRYLEKIFKQASLNREKRFFENRPKLSSSLLEYIRAEIRLIELLKDPVFQEMGKDPFLGSFTVSLSVKQLAFFVFLQVETGILLTRTAKQVHQYFASRFSTLEGGSISEKSFKNAYYSHSPEDILKVIDKLSQMLVIAEESY